MYKFIYLFMRLEQEWERKRERESGMGLQRRAEKRNIMKTLGKKDVKTPSSEQISVCGTVVLWPCYAYPYLCPCYDSQLFCY